MAIANAPGSLVICLYTGEGSRVYFLNPNLEICEKSWNNGWSPPNPLAPFPQGSPKGNTSGANALTCLYTGSGSRVYYLVTNNNIANIFELAWDNNNWIKSGPLGNPPATANPCSPLTCLYTGSGSRVYYLDTNNNIRELAWNDGWQPPSHQLAVARPLSPLTCLYTGSGSRVYYLDPTNNICELAWNNNGWSVTNITNELATHPNSPLTNSPLTCLYTGSGSRVYYLDINNQIRELAWNDGWNPPSEALAPPAQGLSQLTCLYTGSGSRVYYVAPEAGISELAWDGSGWNVTITLANGQPSAGESYDALTCLFSDAGSRVYYVGQPPNNLVELAWDGSGWNFTVLSPSIDIEVTVNN
jgi:hypothetical protein